jgi:hypothetical protein
LTQKIKFMPQVSDKPRLTAELVRSQYERGEMSLPAKTVPYDQKSPFFVGPGPEGALQQIFPSASSITSDARWCDQWVALLDPYRRAQQAQSEARIDAEHLAPVLRPAHHGTASTFETSVEEESPAETTVTCKVVASFLGRVESVGPGFGIVSLINEDNGESLEAQCDLEVLNENGLRRGDEFRCEVLRMPGATSTRIVRLPLKPVSKERVEEVRRRFQNRWAF